IAVGITYVYIRTPRVSRTSRDVHDAVSALYRISKVQNRLQQPRGSSGFPSSAQGARDKLYGRFRRVRCLGFIPRRVMESADEHALFARHNPCTNTRKMRILNWGLRESRSENSTARGCEEEKRNIRITSRSHIPNGTSTSNSFCQGKGTNIAAVVTTLSSPGVKRSAIAIGPPHTVYILATLFVTALSPAVHVLPNHDDLHPAYTKGLLGTCM
ncbi:hypothetical protein BJV77DRAFT_1021083, partial [Russula vinacea]